MNISRTVLTCLLVVGATIACDDAVRYQSAAVAPASSIDEPSRTNPSPTGNPNTVVGDVDSPNTTPEETLVDGGVLEETPIAPALVDEGNVSLLRISKDGNTLLYSVENSDALKALYVYHVPSQRRAMVTDRFAGNLDMSRDGKRVLYKQKLESGALWSDRANLHIFSWDPGVDGLGLERERIDTAVDDDTGAFSPDGTDVFYSHQHSSHPRLRGWNVEAGSLAGLNPMIQDDYQFRAFSSEESGYNAMAYIVETWNTRGNTRYDTANLHIYDRNSGVDRDLGVDIDFDHQMRWSGARLGYQVRGRDEDFRHTGKRFEVLDLNSGDVQATESQIHQLVVSDGLNKAAFQRSGQAEIWPAALVVHTMENGKVDLVTPQDDAYPLFFTADGTWLIYLTGLGSELYDLHAFNTESFADLTLAEALSLPPWSEPAASDRAKARAELPIFRVGPTEQHVAYFRGDCLNSAPSVLHLWNSVSSETTEAVDVHQCDLASVSEGQVLAFEQMRDDAEALMAWHFGENTAQEIITTPQALSMQSSPDTRWSVTVVYEESINALGKARLEALEWSKDTAHVLFEGHVHDYKVSYDYTAVVSGEGELKQLRIVPLAP